MRVTELRGLPIIDPRNARKIGKVDDVLVDHEAGRIAALHIVGPDGEGRERITSDRVKRIGQSAVMLRSSMEGLDTHAPVAVEDCLDLDTLVGLEVMGDDGNRMGTLCDAHINPDSLRIEAWELAVPRMERWLGGGGRVQPNAVLSCSRELMLVRSSRHVVETAPVAESNAPQAMVDGHVAREREQETVGAHQNGVRR